MSNYDDVRGHGIKEKFILGNAMLRRINNFALLAKIARPFFGGSKSYAISVRELYLSLDRIVGSWSEDFSKFDGGNGGFPVGLEFVRYKTYRGRRSLERWYGLTDKGHIISQWDKGYFSLSFPSFLERF